MHAKIADYREEIELRSRMLRLWQVLSDQLSKLFIRHNILVPEMEKIYRRRAAFTALTDPEFALKDGGQGQTNSHAAVLTGLTRQEMSHVLECNGDFPLPMDGGDLHRLIRILTAWRTDPAYLNADGTPADIPLNGHGATFHVLCKRFGRDTPTRPIADVLVNNGNAEWIGGNGRRGKMLRFVNAIVTPKVMQDDGVVLAAQYGSDFLYSLQQCFSTNHPLPRFRQAYFTDVDPDRVDEARNALFTEMEIANQRFIECLKKFRAVDGKAGVRLGAGSYSFQDAPMLIDAADDGAPQSKTTKQGEQS